MNVTIEDIVNHIKSLIKEEEDNIVSFENKDSNILTNMCISISKYKIDILSSLLKDIEGGSISSSVSSVETPITLEPNNDMKHWTDEKAYTLVNNESGELYSFSQLGENIKSFDSKQLLSIISMMHSPENYHVHYKDTTMKVGDNYLNAQEWMEREINDTKKNPPR